MDAWSASNPQKARAVWDRLLGCFGDSLLRKFGPEPPQEWVGAIDALNPYQLDRGMRRIVFGWKGGAPTLPDFMRLCRSVGQDEFDEGRPAVPLLPGEDPWEGKEWQMTGNRHLLAHLMRQILVDGKRYGEGPSFACLRLSARELEEANRDRGRVGLPPWPANHLDSFPQFIANIAKLVEAKDAWVKDMEDLDLQGDVPVETQQEMWDDYINRAEAGISR